MMRKKHAEDYVNCMRYVIDGLGNTDKTNVNFFHRKWTFAIVLHDYVIARLQLTHLNIKEKKNEAKIYDKSNEIA